MTLKMSDEMALCRISLVTRGQSLEPTLIQKERSDSTELPSDPRVHNEVSVRAHMLTPTALTIS